MRIDRLEIQGFGKYQNYTLDMSEGLHVIYGRNEAGKTTLQAFILAMLFGMKKPGKKRTVYAEEHTRYMPWEGKVYGGILHCTNNGQSYRIERNFLKNREDCRIYLALTGEDITNQFPEDSRKERLFLQTLLGIDELMFKNSLCLGDGLRSEWEEWRRETAPKLISGSHLQTADQLLIQKAESVISQRLDEIGSERAESKLLGQAAAKKQQLKLAMDQEEDREAASKDLCVELERWDVTCKQKEATLYNQRVDLAGHISSLLKRLETEKSLTEAAATSLETHGASYPKNLTQEKFHALRSALYRKVESYRSVYQEQATYCARMETLRSDQDSLEFAARYQDLKDRDIQRIEELDLNLSNEYRIDSDKMNGSGAEMNKVFGWNGLILTAGIGVLLAGGILGFWVNWAVGMTAVVAGIVLTVVSRVAGKSNIRTNELLIQQQQEARQAVIDQWEAELLALLKRLDADTPRQARTRWQLLLQTRERLSGIQQQIEWLTHELSKTEVRLQDELESIQKLLRDTGLFHTNLELKRDMEPSALEQLVQEWEVKAEQLLQQLDSMQRMSGLQQEITRWRKRLDELGAEPGAANLSDSPLTAQQLDEKIRAVEQEERLYLADLAKRAELEGRVQAIHQGRAKAADLGRELDYWREQEAKWLRAREALEITKEAFGEIRTLLYREQAPRLVEKVSELADIFTGGRYSSLRVDGQLEVRVTSPDTGYTFEMGGLSKGTSDQLSFALSLAVAESVIKDGVRLPLLIDEPFLHYDDQRLEHTLQYLIAKSEQRQILFFTHRSADVETLQRLSDQQVVVHNL